MCSWWWVGEWPETCRASVEINKYEGHLESKERFAIKKYLLIIGKKNNMQVFITHLHLLLHIVTLDIEALVIPWHRFTYSCLVPDGRLAIQTVHDSVLQVLIICMSLPARCSFIFKKRWKSDGARSGLYGGWSNVSQWNSSRSTLVLRDECRPVHRTATYREWRYQMLY